MDALSNAFKVAQMLVVIVEACISLLHMQRSQSPSPCRACKGRDQDLCCECIVVPSEHGDSGRYEF